MNQHTDGWSDEDVERLKKLRAAGKTRVAIAGLMGRSKGSIIGKLDRLGLSGTKAEQRLLNKMSQKKPAPLRKSNHNPWGWGAVEQSRPEPRPQVRDGRGLPLLNVTPTKSVVELDEGGKRHCRAIGERPDLITLDTPIYCGAETDGGSWCPQHKAEVFRPPYSKNSGGG